MGAKNGNGYWYCPAKRRRSTTVQLAKPAPYRRLRPRWTNPEVGQQQGFAHILAAEPTPMTPRQFRDFLVAEVDKWKRLVKETKLQIEE